MSWAGFGLFGLGDRLLGSAVRVLADTVDGLAFDLLPAGVHAALGTSGVTLCPALLGTLGLSAFLGWLSRGLPTVPRRLSLSPRRLGVLARLPPLVLPGTALLLVSGGLSSRWSTPLAARLGLLGLWVVTQMWLL